MRPSPEGNAPSPGFLEEQLRGMPELDHPDMPEVDVHESEPLLDSSNMTPADWVTIARDIAARYDDYHAFLVIHGTDTMAYTASALSFMFEGLGKTVIVTGAQIPLCEVRSDGHDNLVTSLLVAASPPVPEVSIYFGRRLLRGNRARKVDAAGLEAFDSPNFPPLGVAGTRLSVDRRLLERRGGARFRLREIRDVHVAEMRIFPGISPQVVSNFLRPPLQGLVMETYGVGNAPDRDHALLDAIEEATSRGVVIVSCTQCLRGSVDLSAYATGTSLRRAGVIPGGDMTPEAALTKLSYLLSRGLSPREVRRLMQRDLRGELTDGRIRGSRGTAR